MFSVCRLYGCKSRGPKHWAGVGNGYGSKPCECAHTHRQVPKKHDVTMTVTDRYGTCRRHWPSLQRTHSRMGAPRGRFVRTLPQRLFVVQGKLRLCGGDGSERHDVCEVINNLSLRLPAIQSRLICCHVPIHNRPRLPGGDTAHMEVDLGQRK